MGSGKVGSGKWEVRSEKWEVGSEVGSRRSGGDVSWQFEKGRRSNPANNGIGKKSSCTKVRERDSSNAYYY